VETAHFSLTFLHPGAAAQDRAISGSYPSHALIHSRVNAGDLAPERKCVEINVISKNCLAQAALTS